MRRLFAQLVDDEDEGMNLEQFTSGCLWSNFLRTLVVLYRAPPPAVPAGSRRAREARTVISCSRYRKWFLPQWWLDNFAFPISAILLSILFKNSLIFCRSL